MGEKPFSEKMREVMDGLGVGGYVQIDELVAAASAIESELAAAYANHDAAHRDWQAMKGAAARWRRAFEQAAPRCIAAECGRLATALLNWGIPNNVVCDEHSLNRVVTLLPWAAEAREINGERS